MAKRNRELKKHSVADLAPASKVTGVTRRKKYCIRYVMFPLDGFQCLLSQWLTAMMHGTVIFGPNPLPEI